MNKTIVKSIVAVSGIAGALVIAFVLLFGAIRHAIIEDNEALVHSVAQSLLPALLANDTEQVGALLKALETHPGVQSAELISAQGASIASYARSGESTDLSGASFELAGVDDGQLHVMAPLTFDSLIIANLHIAVNLWPTYLRIMTWVGLLLILPSVVFVMVKQLRLKLRFEVIKKGDGSGGNGEVFNLNTAISTAMSDADISVEFQPIQRMSDGGLFGMEAVVAWRHPSGQTFHISPADFVAMAKLHDVCFSFDEWLLTTACKQAAEWQQQYGPLVLAIHLSAAQFSDLEFAQRVRMICAQTQYPHQLLELEVRESVINSKTRPVDQSLDAFSAQGLSITIKDFGLLNIAQELLNLSVVNKVKLDRKLIRRIACDETIAFFVQSLISSAVASDLQVTASGIEQKDQKDALQRMGCNLGQGPFFNPPLSAKDFDAFLKTRSFQTSNGSLAQSTALDLHGLATTTR